MSIRVGQARLQACERERLEPEGPREPYWAWVSDAIATKGGRSEWFAQEKP